MTYEETIELEKNVKLKNEADKIYQDFLRKVVLKVKNYKGDGKFLHWSDSHNATYFVLGSNGKFTYQARFLHESYDVVVSPPEIFTALKNEYRGIQHLKGAINRS